MIIKFHYEFQHILMAATCLWLAEREYYMTLDPFLERPPLFPSSSITLCLIDMSWICYNLDTCLLIRQHRELGGLPLRRIFLWTVFPSKSRNSSLRKMLLVPEIKVLKIICTQDTYLYLWTTLVSISFLIYGNL